MSLTSSTIIKNKSRRSMSDAASDASTKKARECYYCHEEGHVAADCSKLRKAKQAMAERECFYCKQKGHLASDCAEKKKAAERKAAREAAIASDCAERKKAAERKAAREAMAERECFYCKQPNCGHRFRGPAMWCA